MQETDNNGQAHRTVVVTGAGSGIGAATVDRFRRGGWDVFGIDLNGRDGVIQADVSDPEALGAAVTQLGVHQIDALVCAAGIWSDQDDRYASVDLEVWAKTLAVNVTGTMLTLRTFGPLLGEGGAVVTIASMAALVGMPRRDAYTASKGAIVALTRAWAADLVRRGIRVNCVAPGVVDTPMTERARGSENLVLPFGRPASPDEVAQVIFSIADPRAGYLNGAVIPIDGGMTAAASTVDLSPRPARVQPTVDGSH